MSFRNAPSGKNLPIVNRASVARNLFSGLSRQIISVLVVFSLFVAFLALPAKFTRLLPTASAAGTVLASWGFEGVTTTNTGTAPIVSVGSAAADSGALTAGSAFTAFHTSTATAWSNPAGNGSVKSVSSNNWAVGDSYQFTFSTTSYSAINITWDQTGSATGPRDFKIQYSTNGSIFTDATGTNSTYSLANPAISWSSSGSPNLPSRKTLDLSSVTALDNQSTVYIRVVDTSTTSINAGTVAAGGTGRIDNFSINGTAAGGTPTPTPTATPTPTPTATPTPTPTATPTPTPGSVNNVVISQVYGGGGNTGSTLKNDFIELINHSSAPVDLTGWSVQAFVVPIGGGAGSWQITPLTNFTLQPGQYYLVQESQGAGGTQDLPTADATGTIPVSSTSTRVALVNNTTLLTTDGPTGSGIVDFVGYGTSAGFFEGTGAAPQLSNTTADLRLNEGCFDTDNNASDFVSGDPAPRNSASPAHDCTGISGFGSANPASILQGQSSTLTVHVAAGQNPASTGISVTGNLTSIGGLVNQAFAGSGSSFSFTAIVPADNAPGLKSLPVTIGDAQGRSFTTNIQLSVLPVTPDHIVISQIYGGGGNSGATYKNDFVELYNPTSSPVDIGGWTIQYASSTGTSFQVQPLGGILQPGDYYLISLGAGTVSAPPLPAANISGSINMSGTTGKVALSNGGDAFLVGCPIGDPTLVDFIGYGTADCHEGPTNAPAPSNTTSDLRKNGGLTDTNVNGFDFLTGPPNPRRTAVISEIGPYVLNVDPRSNSTGAPHDDTITVNFTEAVDVDNSWFNINCATSGSHNDATVAHFGDFKTYAITPNTNFQFGEVCTATIFQNAVHDQDTDDSAPGTDTLKADYVWSFTVVAAGSPAPFAQDIHLVMGNPSGATADVSNFDNYLMQRSGNALSYNRSKGTPNWVSWHLDSAWYGTLARVDTFRADPQVPSDWYRVEGFDFTGTGFDRGHMTPNADRDNQFRTPINQETYLMSNMVPQAPDNNQGPWAQMEGDLRTIADSGKELFIVSGPLGVGGTGSNGGTTTTIANGHVTVPAATWKVVLQLPSGVIDPSQVGANATAFAVMMPNTNGIRNNPWQGYKVTVRQVEQATGLNFFSNLAPAVQNSIENGLDGVNPPGTADQTVQDIEDTPAQFTLNAVNPLNGALTVTTSSPAHGSVNCSGINCTYTPQANFNGSDSFTFSVNNGAQTSNTSTATVNVSAVNDAPTANGQTVTTDEDTAKPVTLTGSDIETAAGALTYTVTQNPTHGSLSGTGANLTYTPAANFNGSDSFKFTVTDTGDGTAAPLTSTDATVSITVNAVNDAPIANGQAINLNEDSSKSITLTGTDVETAVADLTYAVTQGPSHGSLTGTGANLTYIPAANFNGSDSFKFTVTDAGDGAASALTSSEGTISITVTSVNDLPHISNDQAQPYPGVQYSDSIQSINFTASDIETAPGSLVPSETFSRNIGPAQPGLPLGLSLVQTSTPGVWTLAGNIQEPAGSYSVNVTITDADGGTDSTSVVINVSKEDATVTISGPTAVQVATVGGSSPSFTLNASVAEAADGSLGTIANTVPVTFQLTPVGSALPLYTCTASAITPGTSPASCEFNNVAVNIYDVTVLIGGSYYQGSRKSVIAVYDPSLGFVSGSGSVSRTVNGETFAADFSVNLKYQKNGTAMGSFTYVEHHVSGDLTFTSNRMDALAITGTEAKMIGTGTQNGLGSYSFVSRFIDMGEPGSNDKLGVRVTDSSGNVVTDITFDPVKLSGGNIKVH